MEIAVNFGLLSSGASDSIAAAKNLGAKLEELNASLKPLRATWTGETAENYDLHQQNWEQSATKLQGVINRVGVVLGEARDAYAANEGRSAGAWNKG